MSTLIYAADDNGEIHHAFHGLMVATVFAAGTAHASPAICTLVTKATLTRMALFAGDTITAYANFTADLSGAGNGTVLFGCGNGNTMTIDPNGTLLSDGNDSSYAGVEVRNVL